ncbi:MAG: hypothetical protein JKY52_08550 [Flavobacteriales bacterium]|nr:hypothetical protein [Flavobacteriales bacterium]
MPHQDENTDTNRDNDGSGFMQKVRERAETAWESDRENREAARDDLKNLAGDQWPELERQKRDQEKRPYLTFNKLSASVRQVTGDLRSNRPSIKVKPVDGGADKDIADTYSGIIRNIEMRSKPGKPYITAGIQAASCGIGNFRIETDYVHSNTFDQDAIIRPIHNPFAVVWDPLARLSTRADARFCFVNERMGREEFKSRWPKAQIVDWDKFENEDTVDQWFDEKTVRVAEYWEKTPVTKTIARLANGEMVTLEDLSEEEREEVEPFIKEQRERESHKVQMWTVSGLEILDGPEEWATPDIPIIAVAGEEIVSDDKVTRVGVIRHAKDAQRMYNYWNTANTEFVALAPKQPYIATVDQIAGFADDWKNANSDNKALLVYNADPRAPGAPQRQTPPMPSSGMISAMQFASDDIKATTGIHDASLGARSNETSGIAIRERKVESDISNNFISDNLSSAVQHAGRILVDLIPIIYDTQRTIRILHEDGSEEFTDINTPNMDMDGPELINDLSVGKYDVDVQTGPSFGTKRQESAETLMQFGAAFPQASPFIADLVAMNMDWPGAEEIAERLRKMLPEGLVEGDDEDSSPEELQAKQAQAEAAQQQQQLQQAGIALQMAEMQAKVEKLQSEAQENSADTANKQADTAQKVLDMAMQTGQFEQMVRSHIAQQLVDVLNQQSIAPAPGNGVIPQGFNNV